MPDAEYIRFTYNGESLTARGVVPEDAQSLERHIGDVSPLSVPDYLAPSLGCAQCPVMRSGEECYISHFEQQPMNPEESSELTGLLVISMQCTGMTQECQTPCKKGAALPIYAVLRANFTGVEPY